MYCNAAVPGPLISTCIHLTYLNLNTPNMSQELAGLFLEATRRYLDHRPAEVGSAVFDKVPHVGILPAIALQAQDIPPSYLFLVQAAWRRQRNACATSACVLMNNRRLHSLTVSRYMVAMPSGQRFAVEFLAAHVTETPSHSPFLAYTFLSTLPEHDLAVNLAAAALRGESLPLLTVEDLPETLCTMPSTSLTGG